ncbi:hypothetical protein IWT25_02347 [Secundilactobacillus pentosiphilus]|uniref:Uncharacterized protein n=1 Tax=Secundilactobacillus pentosiphilus TaxID=1714682 RepID=A0A1Z5IZB5_9LACO|nr:hypothetical protein [Secundilactobacillus pentosiphilus]GAX06999.1 hypothetical protein IWT25_02347 [Secundilactobacillus pentosiphilus]
MKFSKKSLIKRYGIPIRIYQNTSYQDGGTSLTGDFMRTDFRKQPYTDVSEPVAPVSPNANANQIILTSDGKSINCNHEWYSLQDVPFGTVVAIKTGEDEDHWEYLQVVGKDPYYGLSDACIYYLRSNSQEVNSDNEAHDQLDGSNRNNATNDPFFNES